MNSEQSNKKDLINPELPGGFRDALPEDAIAKEAMIETVKTVYERFGFDPMQTSAIERTEVLVGSEGESAKIIFNVKGSRDESDDESDLPAQAGTSLRFDLTIPLARVLASNTDIPKPFKRYQIGKVWRGERQQAGRYREFIQADIDIIGVKNLDADAEVIQVIYETLKALKIDNFSIKLNNKAEAFQLMADAGIPEEKRIQTAVTVDKKEKLTAEDWEKEVAEVSGLAEEKAKEYLWKISGENNLESTEVKELREKCEALGIPQSYLIYDASLMRGLGYYTGSIFEAVLGDLPGFGTVFGGGRYDGLTSRFSTQSIPAVGASLGVDRLYTALEKLGELKKKQTLTQVLILDMGEQFRKEYAGIAQYLRKEGINTAIYLGDDKTFQNQLAYAVKKEIPLVMIYGDKEAAKNCVAIKDLKAGTQEEVSTTDSLTYIKSRLS